MVDISLPTFDDPSLKAALRRAWAGEKAPAELRQRVESLGAAPLPIPMRPSIWRSRKPLLGLAAAALVAVATGVGFHLFHSSPTLPVALAQNLIATHDFCCKQRDHHNILYPQTFPEIRRVVSKDLQFPILADDVPGWNFRGFSECRVGPTLTGHLVFKRSAQDLSLFSLPADSWQGSHASQEASAVDSDHPIAAFVTAEGVYCVVGSSDDHSLTLQDVQAIREQLRQRMSALAEGDEPRLIVVRSH